MNAGAFGAEIHALVDHVAVYDVILDAVRIICSKDLGTGYRSSVFQDRKQLVILLVYFRLNAGSSEAIRSEMRRVSAMRRERFQYDKPNAGSVFKRPMIGLPAGAMIDQAGLKGFQVGGAVVSTTHAGFIVNADYASGDDICRLIEHLKERVRIKFGEELEVEQIAI